MKKINNTLRQIVVISLLCLSLSLSLSAQSGSHIVERGETLSIIAKKYGVTEQQILDINPNAAQFIYVGMELTIPQIQNANNHVSNIPVQQIPDDDDSKTSGANIFLSTRSESTNEYVYDQPEISRYPKGRYGVTVHGYFGADVIKYGANVSFEGLIKGDNSSIGVDYSMGWNVMWNPEFDLTSCVFSLGPFWCTRLDNVDFYLPVKLLCVAYMDGDDKWHTNWGCRVNPLICINIFSCGVFADLAKDATFGLSFGLLW